MKIPSAPQAPPFCPNPRCRFHHQPTPEWRYRRAGFFSRLRPPLRVQRYRCGHCGRNFSLQTFRPSYWLKRPDLLAPVFHQLLACSGYRQIARQYQVSPNTVLTHAARLGRHCLLFHQQCRPRGNVTEPQVLDGFVSFELSQFHPSVFHLLIGARSHYFHGFTVSELRRSGRMTEAQRIRRRQIERIHGRPDPSAGRKDVANLLRTVMTVPQALELHSDDHQDYPRAFRSLPQLSIEHHVTSSLAPRTHRNPLFPANLLDLLIRHSGANHKRETIAFSKRRQSAVERLWILLVWRNYMKSFSERLRNATPAMRLGLAERPLALAELLSQRLFPTRIRLPRSWADHYWRRLRTRCLARCAEHRLSYAF